MADDSGKVPTYVALCPECGGLMACAVAPVDEPKIMRDALKYRGQWARQGFTVKTMTVNDVRTWPDPLSHKEGCSRDRRPRRQRDLLAGAKR